MTGQKLKMSRTRGECAAMECDGFCHVQKWSMHACMHQSGKEMPIEGEFSLQGRTEPTVFVSSC